MRLDTSICLAVWMVSSLSACAPVDEDAERASGEAVVVTATGATGPAFDGWLAEPALAYGNYVAEPLVDNGPMSVAQCAFRDPNHASTAVVFLGGDGRWPSYAGAPADQDGLLRTFHNLRGYLRRICVRLVIVGGRTTYWVNGPSTPNPGTDRYQLARDRVDSAARNISVAIDQELQRHPVSNELFYLGGSMSALLGAAWINRGWTPNSTDRAYVRLLRAFFSGPPAGNLTHVCAHSVSGSTGQAAVQWISTRPCAEFTDASRGNLFPSGARLVDFASRRAISAFVGSADELFGWPQSVSPGVPAWTGGQGVADFSSATGVRCSSPDCLEDPSAIGARRMTFFELPGATHSNTWDYLTPQRTYVPYEICRKAAYDLHPTWSQARRDAVCSGTGS